VTSACHAFKTAGPVSGTPADFIRVKVAVPWF